MLKHSAIVLFAVTLSLAKADSDYPCYLMSGEPAEKPFPSLTQCYKQNVMSCCVSAHDATIQAAFEGLLSGTCNKEYSYLEEYFCLGCTDEMHNFITWYNTTCKIDDSSDCEYSVFDKDNIADDMTKDAWTNDKYSYKDILFGTAIAGGTVGTGALTGDAQIIANYMHGKVGSVTMCKTFVDNMLYIDPNCGARDSNGCVDGQPQEINKFDNCGLFLDAGNKDKDVFNPEELFEYSQGWLPSWYFKNNNRYQFVNEVRPPYFHSKVFDMYITGDPDLSAKQIKNYFKAKDGTEVAGLTSALINTLNTNKELRDCNLGECCFSSAPRVGASILVLLVASFLGMLIV